MHTYPHYNESTKFHKTNTTGHKMYRWTQNYNSGLYINQYIIQIKNQKGKFKIKWNIDQVKLTYYIYRI
jgi:hypothetical protein